MSTNVSYQTIESKITEFENQNSPQEIGYNLLRIFNNMSETRIKRVQEGKDNLSKAPNTIIVKKLLAYTHCDTQHLVLALETLKEDAKILKTVRLLIVSDGETILGYDPIEDESYENTIERLRYDYQFFMPLAGVERYHAPEEKDADIKAAYKMARIFDEIRRYNKIDYADDQNIHALNVFMSRLLFCFFAEDTGIFPHNLFTTTLNDFTLTDGSDLSAFISEAFDIMSTNNPSIRASKPTHISRFPYVNGGLFSTHYEIPTLSWKARKLLLECGELNWAEINPDIFGSMIQAVISPELRSSLGSHYTSVSNIMKLIQPLFLDELYTEFTNAAQNEKRLRQLLIRMGRIKFLDPACGSGNFLIITYKELRKLEILIWEQIEHLNHGMKEIPFSNLSLTQFYGIELDEFAQETSTLSLWLAEHQMNQTFEDRFQTHVDALPLRPSGHIIHGNACRIDWNTVCPHTDEEEVYVMGNPPYLGSSLQTKSQKDDLTLVCKKLEKYKNLDYIACWFILGAQYIARTKAKYAFVSTNSICQGEQVALLWPYIYQNNLEIFFAYRSFKWSNNAKYKAGVTCVIIGIAMTSKTTKVLFHANNKMIVQNISPYLTNATNLIINKRSTPISGLPSMDYGCKAVDGGNLILSIEEKNKLIFNHPITSKWIRLFVGSDDYINDKKRYCLWISDHEKNEALSIADIQERIKETEKVRLKSSDEGARKLASRPHQFREYIENMTDSIIIPRVSSERREYIPMGFLDEHTVISDSAFAIYDAQYWLFGILSSKMHMAWVKAVGGRLKTDYRYSATLCYNTFPFPKIGEKKRSELEEAAEEVLMAREMHTEKTLAQMYDPDHMPTDLREAHAQLDRVVESCYRTVPFLSDEERLEHLFALYEKMTKQSRE